VNPYVGDDGLTGRGMRGELACETVRSVAAGFLPPSYRDRHTARSRPGSQQVRTRTQSGRPRLLGRAMTDTIY